MVWIGATAVGSVGSTLVASPRPAPAAASSAVSSTAMPVAVSQPKKQAPNFMPPKRSFCRATTSLRLTGVSSTGAVEARRSSAVDVGTGRFGTGRFGTVRRWDGGAHDMSPRVMIMLLPTVSLAIYDVNSRVATVRWMVLSRSAWLIARS